MSNRGSLIHTKRKVNIDHRNTIWRAAQAIGAGYKNAARDHQSVTWVLRYIVKTFGSPDHSRLADIVLRKIELEPDNAKQILVEAFAQAAAEQRRKTDERVDNHLNSDGLDEAEAILRLYEKPQVASKPVKDPPPTQLATISLCTCKNNGCPGKCEGTCGCKRCERGKLLRDRKFGPRPVA